MKSVLLIDPASEPALAARERFDGLRRWRHMPHLGLQVLAHATAPHDVRILDERLRPLDPARVEADVVGITARTAQAPRAHALARAFHARGIPVVLGGPYATLSPGRAAADPAVTAVVTGPASGVWPRVLSDVLAGKPERIYRGAAAAGVPVARRDLPALSYRPGVGLVQLTQGCNFRCRFCVIPQLYDREFLAPAVHDAIEAMIAVPQSYLFIVDDNLIGNLPFANRLFEAMAGLGKEWSCQATLNVARSPEMLALMRRAGCRMVNIGLESLSSESLVEQDKKHNFTVDFAEAIARLHDSGILASCGFVFGFDEDDATIFDRTLEFILRTGVDFAMSHVLTPYPGLELFDKLEAAGRLLTGDLARYTTYDVVFRPAKMTPDQLQEGFERVVRAFYSRRRLPERLVQSVSHVGLKLGVATTLGHFVTGSNLRHGLPIHA